MTSNCKIHHLPVMNFTRYSREYIEEENWLADVTGHIESLTFFVLSSFEFSLFQSAASSSYVAKRALTHF